MTPSWISMERDWRRVPRIERSRYSTLGPTGSTLLSIRSGGGSFYVSLVLCRWVQGVDQRNMYVVKKKRHDGSVWQVSWAHPKFGSILASCSYDGKVIVWKEGDGASSGGGRQAGGGWQKIKEHTLHTASGEFSGWCLDFGAVLAVVRARE